MSFKRDGRSWLVVGLCFALVIVASAGSVEAKKNPEKQQNKAKNWVHKRGMLYLTPGHVSLFNDDLLQETIRTSVDQSMVQAMADAAAEDRMLQIGATNLDFGIGRIFDMSQEASEAIYSDVFE